MTTAPADRTDATKPPAPARTDTRQRPRPALPYSVGDITDRPLGEAVEGVRTALAGALKAS